MSCCSNNLCSASGTPGSACACGGVFTNLDSLGLDCTLTGGLTPIVDCVRDIFTQLGQRQYQVNLVWTRWSGGVRGEGEESVVKVELVSPTPEILSIGALRNELQSIGNEEMGEITIAELSPRFTEDYLMGRDTTGIEIPSDMNFYWEIYLAGQGLTARRRFVPKSAPEKDVSNFQWKIDLVRASGDRARDGYID